MVSRIPPPQDDDAASARSSRPTSLLAVVLVVALAVGVWFFTGGDPDLGPSGGDTSAAAPATTPADTSTGAPDEQAGSAEPTDPASPTTSPEPAQSAAPGELDPDSGLPTVYLLDLPPEAAATVEAIERGPPFAYDQDGSTFNNFEGLLPDEERGYYREFTVETPGSPDRGARRIVEGASGELYWTDDHYASFSRIVL